MRRCKWFGYCGVIAAGLLLTSAFGCGSEEECTEMGCDDELRIQFVDEFSDPLHEFHGELSFDGEVLEFDCSTGEAAGEGYRCDESVLIVEAAPTQAELMAASGLLGASTTVEPQYDELQPNGPECGPTCYQGEVEVMVEPGVDCLH